MNAQDAGKQDSKPARVSVYVDGFNFYFGMKESRYQRFYWINIHELAKAIIDPEQELVDVKYFTARVSGPREKARRQTIYLEAIKTTAVRVFEGKFQAKPL